MSLERELVRDLNKYAGVPAHYSAVDGSMMLGLYTMECYSEKGQLIWREQFHNLLTTVGVHHMMDHTLQTIVTPIVGPFMGLVGNATGTPDATFANGDTMGTHSGWTECGAATQPTYTAPRKTTVGQWAASSARAKALSSPQVYAITGTGTVQGAFMVTGAGAVSTIDNGVGILFSAGPMTEQPVIPANSLSVSWSLTFT